MSNSATAALCFMAFVCAVAGEEKLMYSAFGAGCSEVEVNMLTGERRVLRADIMMDAGNSLSPAIDAGQVPLMTPHSFGIHAIDSFTAGHARMLMLGWACRLLYVGLRSANAISILIVQC